MRIGMNKIGSFRRRLSHRGRTLRALRRSEFNLPWVSQRRGRQGQGRGRGKSVEAQRNTARQAMTSSKMPGRGRVSCQLGDATRDLEGRAAPWVAIPVFFISIQEPGFPW